MAPTLPSPTLPSPPLRPLLVAAALLGTGCWAPSVESPATEEPGGTPELETETEGWPAAPFSAWTARPVVSIVGPGGDTVALVEDGPVALTVLQVLPTRVRVRCDGCAGEATGVEGWLQPGAVWFPGAPTPAPAGLPAGAGGRSADAEAPG